MPAKCILFNVLSFLLSCMQLSAQALIKGQVADSSLQPLRYPTIIIRTDNNKFKQSLSGNDSGQFEFLADTGSYSIEVTAVGFIKKTLNFSVRDENAKVDLGIIIPGINKKLLSEVKVQAQRHIYGFQPGKIIYEVSNDPRNTGLNGLEVLRFAPLVSVNGSGSIQLKGRSTFVFQLNGKTYQTLASNAFEYLQSIDQSQIERIEVITNPSARYSAEGITGIINIVTRKDKTTRPSGSFSVGYDTYQNTVLSANVSGRQGKWGYSMMASENFWKNGTYDYHLFQSINSTSFSLAGQTTPRRNNFIGVASISYQQNKWNIFNIDISTFLGNGTVFQDFSSGNRLFNIKNQLDNRNNSVNFDWEHKIDSISSFVFSYKNESQKNSNEIIYNNPNAVFLNKGSSDEHTFQLDYKLKGLEIGSKAILRELHSYTGESKANEYSFGFYQNIYALYLSYNKKIKNYNLEAGIRGESTQLGCAKNKDSVLSKDSYLQLFPSISIDRTFEKSNTNISLGYSRRIMRPQLFYLNPFYNTSNPYAVTNGNPVLHPELSHNIEFRVTKRERNLNYHILSLSYQYGSNSIINYLYPLDDSVITNTFINFRKQHLFGLSYYSTLMFLKKIQVSFSNNIYWTNYPKLYLNDLNAGQKTGMSGFFGSFGLTVSGVVLKKVRVVNSNTFNLSELYLQGKGSSFFYQDLTIVAPVLKNKVMAYVSIRQPFIYDVRYRTSYSAYRFSEVIDNTTPQRRLYMGFKYSFGKPSPGNARTRKKISNEDKKSKDALDTIK